MESSSSSCGKHLPCHRVCWTKETLLRDLDTFVWHSYLRVELFIYWPLIIGHNRKWLNISVWHIDGTLTGSTILGQSGSGGNGNDGVLDITPNSRIEASPSDGLVSYLGHLVVGIGLITFAEMQLKYSTAPAYWEPFMLTLSLLFFFYHLSQNRCYKKIINWLSLP